jgi:DNA polymerase III subunit gamma/tau
MSLYTKYRPQDFDNLVWQKFIKETLKTAIAENKLVWAYLFCWPRWTGKTSTARLLAKTINCLNPKNWNPCLECEICRDFAEEKLIDIIEIDAASHTGVDNIREIIEKAQFSPTRAKFKVYIIDEVHMLSKWAFNALLKILEEPPSHVKFILATTETQKVPETIISRCQKYDFKRIWKIDIIERLKFISENEWIKVDDKSYEYIANHSNWGLRNAISLYEQLITDNKITYSDIIDKLWLTWEKELENFLQKLLNKDISIIDDFNLLVSKWKNIKLFFKELIFYTKDKILEKLKKNEEIWNCLNIIEILNETYSKTKNSLDENTSFVIWILRILEWFKSYSWAWVENLPPIPPPLSSSQVERGVASNKEKSISKEDVESEFFEVKEWDYLKDSESRITDFLLIPERSPVWHSSEWQGSNSEWQGLEWHKTKLPPTPLHDGEKKEFDISTETTDNLWQLNEGEKAIKLEKNSSLNSISPLNEGGKKEFDINMLISNLKSAGASWALTMALRWSEIYIDNKDLNIKLKTQISRKSVENIESMQLIKNTLSQMWYNEISINVS